MNIKTTIESYKHLHENLKYKKVGHKNPTTATKSNDHHIGNKRRTNRQKNKILFTLEPYKNISCKKRAVKSVKTTQRELNIRQR